MILPAKDVPLFREFVNPVTGGQYVRLAYDRKADSVLALDAAGGYWHARGSFLVELQPVAPVLEFRR